METVIYLDTHVVVWLYDREIEKLSAGAAELIEKNQLYISEFVRLELKYLEEIERLQVSPDRMVSFLADEIGLEVCTLPLAPIITEAMNMSWTRDPFDRLIAANASYGNHTLLTKDEKILTHYPKARF
jgi:PIN domain nuclease of toxin-antitoxin system